MPIRRRDFLGMAAAGGLWLAMPRPLRAQNSPPIDRMAVVSRHNPVVRTADPFSALTVGNGMFAFTSDVTGLQTFLDDYNAEFPLCTASHWGWHTTPLPDGLKISDYRFKDYDTHGRPVGYATSGTGQEQLYNWLRENPHRMHLGRIGFEMTKSDGSRVALADLANIEQTLNLWTGELNSRFQVDGKPVHVRTICHPDQDCLAVSIESPLLANGQLQVAVAFPYPSPETNMADWISPNRHKTTAAITVAGADFQRQADGDTYEVHLAWSIGQMKQRAAHEFVLSGSATAMELVCLFAQPPYKLTSLPSFDQTKDAAAAHWQKFWSEGGCVDLGNCTDARAPELERRIVLSQYNTALHCCGPMPPAETGLLFNSWYGKAHLEMHWWHAAHFAVWNRFALLDRSLDYYHRIMHVGQATAARQGYKGCRWPKMVGPDGRDSPSPIAPLLIWQQPHPIYYAELSYRQSPTDQTLRDWQEIVFQSADFMASYAFLDDKTGRYTLGPPLKTVSENTDTLTTTDPTFELAYCRFGLRVAQEWRHRLGMAPEPTWAAVLDKLAPLPQADGRYLMQEGMTDTYTNWNWEHPALLGACGMQPGDGVDPTVMRNTVRKVFEVWQWDRAWGWDFPMAALAAARAGEPELAVTALAIVSPKNRYHPNGHVYQRANLTAYLPANGGLLSAVAEMCAGWTGGPTRPTPGFPADGKWDVRFENLRTWI
jgi:protein-glucosylgalactosylhydroxylysine glucosidase